VGSRAILNWALLGGVVILAAAVYYLPGQKHKPPPPPLIAGVTPEQIHHIHITRTGKQDIDLVREQGHWRLTAPLHTAANGFRADALASVVEADSESRFSAVGEDLAKFGLAPPRARLKLDGVVIKFGDNEPISGRRYVQVGDVIHLIPDYSYQNVAAAAPGFVSLSPLPEGAEPVSFTLPGFTLRRDEKGHWKQVAGSHNADPQAIDDFVGRWQQAEALEVTRYTPAGARDTVTVGLGGGRPAVEFDIVSRDPELVLGRHDLAMAYHFPASEAAKLLTLSAPAAKSGDKPPPAR
jgi:hypothetical protein